MGMLSEEAGPTTYYLAQGDKAHAVADGAVINSTYRVNGLKGTQLSLTYLPLGIDQSLAMPAGGSTNRPSVGGGALQGTGAPQAGVAPQTGGATGMDPTAAAAPPRAALPRGSIKDAVKERMGGQLNPGQPATPPPTSPSTPGSVVFTAPASFGVPPPAPPQPAAPAPAAQENMPSPPDDGGEGDSQ
jgi:hypothetical protein